MKITAIIATATTAAVLATAGVSIAGATTNGGPTNNDAPASASAPKAGHPGRIRRVRAVRRHAFLLSAKTIGVSPAELLKDLQSGQTIAAVATAHNVQPQTVVDALVKAADARIEKARDAGKLTADQATKLEAKVPALAARFVNNPHPHAGAKRNK